ncbi:MAG: histidine phosphatase family protein [Trueperaceae bacterium]|nr:histidine phosphatase family protein [Trueperaceae bacterium]
MDALDLWLIRHGETHWNRHVYEGTEYQGGRLQPPDSALSDDGFAQAERLAQRLKGEVFDAVYTSDMLRATQTAEVVFAGREVGLEPRIREISRGIFEQFTLAELSDAQRDQRNAWRADKTIRPPGGENLDDLAQRVRTWLGTLPVRGRVAAVTHSGVILTLLAEALGAGNARSFFVGNASLTRLRRYDDRTTILSVGDRAHLEAWTFRA